VRLFQSRDINVIVVFPQDKDEQTQLEMKHRKEEDDLYRKFARQREEEDKRMREEFRVSAALNGADTFCPPAYWPDWQASSKMCGLLGKVSILGGPSTGQQCPGTRHLMFSVIPHLSLTTQFCKGDVKLVEKRETNWLKILELRDRLGETSIDRRKDNIKTNL
jgi:hypothetical protein